MSSSSSSFVALYRGPTIASARLVAVSADPDIVSSLAGRLLTAPAGPAGDGVLDALAAGQRAALRRMRQEAEGGAA